MRRDDRDDPFDDLFRELERMMNSAFDNVFEIYEERNLHMRTAAYLLAIDRVAEAGRLRGMFP